MIAVELRISSAVERWIDTLLQISAEQATCVSYGAIISAHRGHLKRHGIAYFGNILDAAILLRLNGEGCERKQARETEHAAAGRKEMF